MTGQYTKICSLSDLREGEVRSFSANGREIVLAIQDGAVYALDNLCTHDGGDLGDGELKNGHVECPRHGAWFDIKTGAAIRMPAVEGIQTYEVKIENGEVFVALAE
ncbi:Naphthalene 1,2-dioxygenase system ferredoxin subunit [Candidatus Zixiibacteriota bacterium]|nr:Naphthalene 1,2-dioxygenase system ferredoxin subunit [candidate division Zixibacteria bacterium]